MGTHTRSLNAQRSPLLLEPTSTVERSTLLPVWTLKDGVVSGMTRQRVAVDAWAESYADQT
jgi:hypothetical protein